MFKLITEDIRRDHIEGLTEVEAKDSDTISITVQPLEPFVLTFKQGHC